MRICYYYFALNNRSSFSKELLEGVKDASKPLTADSSSNDVLAATYLDVAVLRCLFIAHWPEEGVFWALQFLYLRSIIIIIIMVL